MERNYNNREFEQYVKRNADQYRMIPSEKVWKGINNSLHTRRKWYGIGLVSLLLLTAVSVTWVMFSYSGAKQQAATNTIQVSKSTILIEPANPIQAPSVKSSSEEISKLLSINKFDKTDKSTEAVQDNSAIKTNTENNLPENATGSAPLNWNTGRHLVEITVNSPSINTVAATGKKQTVTTPATSNPSATQSEPAARVTEKDNIVMSKVPFHTVTREPQQHTVLYPLTIESVVNSYRPKKIRKKLAWQLYITPTVSYRRLKANKAYRNEGPFADPITYPFSSLTDVNKAVTHKPDMGLELGFSAGYPLNKKLKLRAGLQFNINRYDIKAFVSNGEQATINLAGDNNSVTAWTYYRNYNGYKSDWLKNFYFSVSAPLGVELKLFGNKKTSFGVAGTVQPTYILREKAYLISTDYKNYANVPWLIRDLNVNTSFETFVSFTSRSNTRWQIGPQVRYQVLSSFHDKYPVRENLFDYGIKIGVSLNQ